jgi:pentatricopeptide repeat protein
MLLGQIAFSQRRTSEAESFFKAAATADPIQSDAYVNLAIVCVRGKRFEQARNYYNQALERGAAPDLELEKRLSQP